MQYKDILSEIEFEGWTTVDIEMLIDDLKKILEKRECPLKGRMGQCSDGKCFHLHAE